MEVHLTDDQKAFVRQGIESGRYSAEAAIDVAEASIARDAGRIVTQQSMRELADEVKQRGRARLVSEKHRPSR